MSISQVVEYLEKYAVAPSPSRDYYGIKVIGDEVILYTWKISHGPHIHPIVRKLRFRDFDQDKTMRNEIQRVFGESTFRYIRTIAQNKEKTLITLPKNLIKKLTSYLRFKDVIRLSTLSRMANEVFNSDVVWEVLYKRHKTGLVYKDEREQGSSYGWKRLFKERQMHKPARERKTKKLQSGDHRLSTPTSSVKSQQKTDLTLAKNSKQVSNSTTELIGGETTTKKSVVPRSCRSFSGRTNAAIKGRETLSAKKMTGGAGSSFPDIDTSGKAFSLNQVKVKKREEPKKILSIEYRTKKSDVESCGDQNSAKKFPNSKSKTNSSSTGRIKSNAVTTSSSGLEQRASSATAKKMEDPRVSGGNQDVVNDVSLENFLLPNRLHCRESDSSLTVRSKATGRSKGNFSSADDEKKSAMYKKFPSPIKVDGKITELVEKPSAIRARKSADIKARPKRDDDEKKSRGKELEPCKRESKPDHNVKSCSRVTNKATNKTTTVTKYESRNFLDNESYENSDSNVTVIKLSQRFGLKKRGNLNKR